MTTIYAGMFMAGVFNPSGVRISNLYPLPEQTGGADIDQRQVVQIYQDRPIEASHVSSNHHRTAEDAPSA